MSDAGALIIGDAVQRIVTVLKSDAFTKEEMLKLRKIIETLGRITEKALSPGPQGVKAEDDAITPAPGGPFTLHDGTSQVRREKDGTVILSLDFSLKKPKRVQIMEVKFTPSEWCSVVTAVAKDADISETHEAVKAIHGAW